MIQKLRPTFFNPVPEDYLNAAKATAQWIKASAIQTPEGIYWPEQPFQTSSEGIPFSSNAPYSGSAGVFSFSSTVPQRSLPI